ncbi:multidrug effflux MFS transporter [Niabella sp. CC-SYL272]|uniref:multidrug effflux MFS transporter n=1 Tax=Niabella agricola TaxID=2891571 RepID=UPI001F23B2B3|nr:multidrug effflux MFS transporter [Niabella agricola]MCF3109637.1 multidrug effflux MFS transporter [Niabella agricola]
MKMKQGELIALSASAMMLTALGIDIMLPAFAELRKDYGLDQKSPETAKIISFFFLGQIAQIIFGTLSDRFGRLPILRIGFPLYILGGIAAAFAPNLVFMLGARFIAGVGASAVFMTTIASVRDRFCGNEMARIMSLIFTVFLFTPVIAPFLGSAILHIASWQAVFLAPPLFGFVVFLWSLRLDESLPKNKRTSLHFTSISKSMGTVLHNRTFLRYTGITTLLFTALSSYVASSEHIIGGIYGKPSWFPWIFGGMGLFMTLSTFTNAHLSAKYGAHRTIKSLLIIYTLIAAGLLLGSISFGDPPNMLLFFIAVTLIMAITLAVEPNSCALALEPLGSTAGTASSLYGTTSFSIGAALGSIISNLMASSVFPLVLGYLVIGTCGLLLAFNDRRCPNNSPFESA